MFNSRLIWAVIPLVLFGIIGIQESEANTCGYLSPQDAFDFYENITLIQVIEEVPLSQNVTRADGTEATAHGESYTVKTIKSYKGNRTGIFTLESWFGSTASYGLDNGTKSLILEQLRPDGTLFLYNCTNYAFEDGDGNIIHQWVYDVVLSVDDYYENYYKHNVNRSTLEQESSTNEKTWYLGEGLKQHDLFSYRLCHVDYKGCTNFQMDIWIEGDVQRESENLWFAKTIVYEGNKLTKGVMHLGKDVAPRPVDNWSADDLGYPRIFGITITGIGYFANKINPQNLTLDDNWNDEYIHAIGTIPRHIGPIEYQTITIPAGTFDSTVVSYWNFPIKYWIVDNIPFPVKGEAWDSKNDKKSLIYRFELLEYHENVRNDPFVLVTQDQELFEKDSTLRITPFSGWILPEKTSNAKTVCEDTQGKWIKDFNECERTGSTTSEEFESYCKEFDGKHTECHSHCRNMDGFYEGNLVCSAQCVQICEFPIPGTNYSPKEQVDMGISSDDIACKKGLKLVFKPSNGNPSCVKSETALKLLERGWTKEITTAFWTNIAELKITNFVNSYLLPKYQLVDESLSVQMYNAADGYLPIINMHATLFSIDSSTNEIIDHYLSFNIKNNTVSSIREFYDYGKSKIVSLEKLKLQEVNLAENRRGSLDKVITNFEDYYDQTITVDGKLFKWHGWPGMGSLITFERCDSYQPFDQYLELQGIGWWILKDQVGNSLVVTKDTSFSQWSPEEKFLGKHVSLTGTLIPTTTNLGCTTFKSAYLLLETIDLI